MKLVETPLPGVLVIEPAIFADDRGRFYELFRDERYSGPLGGVHFVQDNISESRRGVVRGLHYQYPAAMGKLVTAVRGSVFDVAVDIRRGSSTFGKWFGVELDAERPRQLWVPPGFAHGFQALTEGALVAYKCTAPYVPADDRAIHWGDPTIGVRWPIEVTVVAKRDREALRLADVPAAHLPQ
jgi:dTDP-4-dehydrorhamnose 3,5-epimerase